jgi:hypothetical protein
MMAEYPPALWRLARFRFHLRLTEAAILPLYKGAVFRGVFGKALCTLVCVAPQAQCRECAFALKYLSIPSFRFQLECGAAIEIFGVTVQLFE